MNPNYTDIFGRLNYNDRRIRTVANTVNNPPYKVYTALLTQSGGDEELSLETGLLTIGVTYYIDNNGGNGWDFTNVGAPNNDIGTYFVATGTTPNSWGVLGNLLYNTGAPVVTVLENTIGNIWWAYNSNGEYFAQSDGLFTINKTFVVIGTGMEGVNNGILTGAIVTTQNQINIQATASFVGIDDELSNTSFEIRVYN